MKYFASWKRKMSLIKRIFYIITSLGLSIYLGFLSVIVYQSWVIQPEKSDVILVLGCQIWGYSPSPTLKERLTTAKTLYMKQYAKYIIVSGGKGSDEPTSESVVMKKWLVSNGVPQENILEENRSTSTYENLQFSKSIMNRQNFKTAVIITSNFHICRSIQIAQKQGLSVSGCSSPIQIHLIPYYYTREVMAYIKYICFHQV